MISPYQQNKKYPEQLCHKTISGNLVRSKSEALIDMCLCNHNIPFRYECALELGEATYFPDFTILHPKTEKLYFWEHFGRMDDPNYCKAAFSKMQTYALHGIVPSVNFITTYETRENPLNAETVENWIAHCFL